MVQSSVVWIDTKETIPANNRDVLVFVSPLVGVRIGHYNRGEWMWQPDRNEGKVIYWAEMPDLSSLQDRD